MRKIAFITLLLLMSFVNTSVSAANREEHEKTGQVIWEVKTKEKLVALTFDDGPHPFITPQILDILAKYHAKATFFVTGLKAEQYPELIKREVAEGHEIANHTYDHIPHNELSPRILSKEIQKADTAIQKITGVTPFLFRPVGGHFDDWVIKSAVKQQKTVVLWTWGQDSRDWKNPPANKICSSILNGVKPGNIILFHDWHGAETSKRCTTTAALTNILDYLQRNGYQCVTVSDMLFRTSQIIPDLSELHP
ncbi:polysaccharide deacetylase family protein [Bacillus sp. BRMEA1]|uniref:polysaccharide deacetylase family protein n=1 Tax=Neobacillus endophyticus TaxID=2738405 RepID=UPI001565E8FB|nr:polysaccharide deacetylase family protein [Neobacillus endophyticus]NRD77118.1 polysaccharide deacetylase family protein [Neobacillus endophyticus]